MKFTVQHNYCGMTKVIEGNNVYDAFKKNNLDIKVWTVIDVE
jgi:hypothetical protein